MATTAPEASQHQARILPNRILQDRFGLAAERFASWQVGHHVATKAGASQNMGIYASSFQKNKSKVSRTALASLELLTNACLPCALGSNNGLG